MSLLTGSDGMAVAASAADAATLPLAPLLVLEALEAYLDRAGLGHGPVQWERIGEGHSNVTFRIARTGVDLVLRRGPRPPLPPSAHDMVREARIQDVLGRRDVPTPRIVDVCDDTDVLGVPFYLMEHLGGVVVTDELPRAATSPEERRAMADVAVDTLVALHRVSLDDEVASFGRPEGYLARQVGRFAGLWAVNSLRTLPLVDKLADWLETNRPTTLTFSVVHGDYRLGNLMYPVDSVRRVLAVLDWEMATLGDPLADLGYFLATYSDGADEPTTMELTTVTRLQGFPSRADLRARYADHTGLDLSALPWYSALALWKAAIFSEAIYTRYLHGERPGDSFGPSLEAGVPYLLESAWSHARQLP